MKVLVTGAAGYIGSVVTEQLITDGYTVIAFDNLQNGWRGAIHPDALCIEGDLCDEASVKQVLGTHPVDAVIHLAAEALIDESIRNPGRFYRVNTCGGLNLLEAMRDSGVTRIVFSSTAAVYGEPVEIPITEDHPREPVNSYGDSKLAFERMLRWYQRACDLRHISLRYFNACGATSNYGEHHVPETHLVPVLFEAALGQRPTIQLFGTDYDTPDGTCVRDYIHVSDIARAHVLALARIDDVRSAAYNLGNSTGYTNRQVIAAVQQVTSADFPVIPAPRRPGDPARLVASSERIRRDLGWEPQYSDLKRMIETAWEWRSRHPRGYEQ